jgi:hypothetical protein
MKAKNVFFWKYLSLGAGVMALFLFLAILLPRRSTDELDLTVQPSTRIPLSSSSKCEQALSTLSWKSIATAQELAEDTLSSTNLLPNEPLSTRAARAARRLQLLSEKALAAAELLRYEVDPDGLFGGKDGDALSFFKDLDANGRPGETSVECYLQSDSSDLCVYDNLCVDIPSDTSMPTSPTLLFIKDTNVPSTDRMEESFSKLDTEALRASITRRYNRRNNPSPSSSSSSPSRVKTESSPSSDKSTMKLSWDFEDILDENPPGEYERMFPFGNEYIIQEISPEETVPIALGGQYEGSITWLDDFFLSTNVLSSHLWGSSMSIFFPIFGAAHANKSLNLNLPPIRNLILTAAQDEMVDFTNRAWLDGNPWKSEGGSYRWAWGFLEELLAWLAQRDTALIDEMKPFIGIEKRKVNEQKLPLEKVRIRQRLEEKVKWNFKQCVGELTRSTIEPKDLILETETLNSDEPLASYVSCIVRSLSTRMTGNFTPYRSLFHSIETDEKGTRLIFTSKDLPEDAIARAFVSELSRLNAKSETLHKLNQFLLRRPHRVCAKKAVVLGPKELLMGGQSEATLIRRFSAERFGAPKMSTQYLFPTSHVLFLDRGVDSSPSLGPYGRYFDNVEEMKDVLNKYNIQYTYVTDKELYSLSFVEQGKLFASHGVLISAHGAGMVNAAFMPPRSSILEINPYNLWCPIYSRGLTAAGYQVFTITSHLKGRNLDYAYLNGRVTPEEIRQNAEKEAPRCEVLGNVKASTDGDCWMSFKTASIRVPIAEFEHKVLQALEAVGDFKYPISSPIALLEGEEEERGDPLAQLDDKYYQSRKWKLCPPQSSCDKPKQTPSG